jgi:hypothetical protein
MTHYKIGLILTSTLHGILLFAMAAVLPHLLLHSPAWFAFPIIFMLINFIWSGGATPLTDLENSFRKKLGIPRIHCFIGHYITGILK